MDGWDERVGGVPCWPVDDKAVVVACAVSAAEADGGINVLADKFRRGEVWRAIIGVHGGNFAVGDEDAVCGNEAGAERQVESDVVEDVGIAEAVEVPVDVVSGHDGSCLGQGERHKFGGELWGARRVVVVDGVCCVGEHVTGKALQGFVVERESDRGVGLGSYGPVALVIANVTAVKSVKAVILIFGDVVLVVVDGEGAVLDAVGIAADDSAEEVRVGAVFGRVVVAYNNILRGPVAVGNKQ